MCRVNGLFGAIGLGSLVCSLTLLGSTASHMLDFTVRDSICRMDSVRRQALESIAAGEPIDIEPATETCER
jgi:hypothetical protein